MTEPKRGNGCVHRCGRQPWRKIKPSIASRSSFAVFVGAGSLASRPPPRLRLLLPPTSSRASSPRRPARSSAARYGSRTCPWASSRGSGSRAWRFRKSRTKAGTFRASSFDFKVQLMPLCPSAWSRPRGRTARRPGSPRTRTAPSIFWTWSLKRLSLRRRPVLGKAAPALHGPLPLVLDVQKACVSGARSSTRTRLEPSRSRSRGRRLGRRVQPREALLRLPSPGASGKSGSMRLGGKASGAARFDLSHERPSPAPCRSRSATSNPRSP